MKQRPYCPEKVNGKYRLDCRIRYLEEQHKEDAERTLAVLREVEWCDPADDDDAGCACRFCYQPDWKRHKPSCELAALIAYWEEVKND